jgi:hypothetical protein
VAQKKSNVGLLIGLGCGALLLIGTIGAVGFYFAFVKPAKDAVDAAKAVYGTTTSTATTSTATSGSSGSGACAKASECCKNMILKTGGDAAALANCDNFKNLPEVGCVTSLENFKKAAPAVGARCD